MCSSGGNRWDKKVVRFNKTFPPGTPVVYTSPSGIITATKIQYPAKIMSDGFPVIWLKAFSLCVEFDRVVCV
jgi:hypothetical protein